MRLLQNRLFWPALGTFVLVLTSLMLLRSRMYHVSLTPLDRHIFSCKMSIRIENIPPTPDPPRLLPSPAHPARRVSADELLASPDVLEQYRGRIIHQSWKTDDLSDSAYAKWQPIEKWSAFHSADDGWVYCLWTNADNRKLVELKFPQFLEVFDAFPWEILRADFSRPLYMAAFGGIYADLDLLPLSNLGEHLAFGQNGTAWLGQIHLPNPTNRIIPYSVPNAFLSSSAPHHPFWLHYANAIDARFHAGEIDFNNIEDATGPAALFRSVQTWHNHNHNGMYGHGRGRSRGEGQGQGHDRVVVLPKDKIYPFSWASETAGEKCVCFADRAPEFDPERCNELFSGAWTITYWKSGWMVDVGS